MFDPENGSHEAIRATALSWDPVALARVSEVVATDLRRRIVAGDYRDGDQLPSITALTETYGVSRPTIRETFRLLEAEQLLSLDPGTRATYTIHTPSEAAAARSLALRLHLGHGTTVDLLRLRGVLERPLARWVAARPNAMDALGSADVRDLHRSMATLSPNVTAATMLGILRETMLLQAPTTMSTCLDEVAHRQILAVAGDTPSFVAAWARHLDEVAEAEPDQPFMIASDRLDPSQTPTHRAARLLRNLIIDGTLAIGDRLPAAAEIEALAGVSASAHRQALRILESRGLIRIQLGVKGGATVAMPSSSIAARSVGLLLQMRGATMIDFLHLRAEVEAAIAEQAARHAGPLNELRYALDVESGLVADRVAFTSAGLTFHALLSERSGSLALRLGFGLLDGVLQLVARARTEALEEAGVRVATAHQEHEALVGLIAAGRPTQARELWARHCAPRRSPDDRTPLDIFALLEQPPGARTRW